MMSRKKLIILIFSGAMLLLSGCGTNNYSKKNQKSCNVVISADAR